MFIYARNVRAGKNARVGLVDGRVGGRERRAAKCEKKIKKYTHTYAHNGLLASVRTYVCTASAGACARNAYVYYINRTVFIFS